MKHTIAVLSLVLLAGCATGRAEREEFATRLAMQETRIASLEATVAELEASSELASVNAETLEMLSQRIDTRFDQPTSLSEPSAGLPIPNAPKIKRIAEHHVQLLDMADWGGLKLLARQARVVPSFHQGVPIGFRLFSIRPNSYYQAIGLQNGDIVTRLNGLPLDSPDTAMAAYSALRGVTTFEVQFLRNDKPLSLRVDLPEPFQLSEFEEGD